MMHPAVSSWWRRYRRNVSRPALATRTLRARTCGQGCVVAVASAREAAAHAASDANLAGPREAASPGETQIRTNAAVRMTHRRGGVLRPGRRTPWPAAATPAFTLSGRPRPRMGGPPARSSCGRQCCVRMRRVPTNARYRSTQLNAIVATRRCVDGGKLLAGDRRCGHSRRTWSRTGTCAGFSGVGEGGAA